MNAALLLAPRAMEVRHVPPPEVAPDGALVRVSMVGVCGSDLKLWRFGSPRLRLPAVIGHEVVGVVESAPAAHADLVGRRVVLMPDVPCFACPPCRDGHYNLCDVQRSIGWELAGGFAERVAIPPQTLAAGGLLPVPAGLPDELATLAEPVACALRGQEPLEIGPSDAVLVIGAGPMGYLHTCLARLRGARVVILCDLLARRLEQAADAPADVRLVADASLEGAVRALTTDRGGPDVVIVAAATATAQTTGVRLAAKRGRVNFYASLPAAEAGRFDINPIHSRELRVVATRDATTPSLRAALDLLASGRLPTRGLTSLIEPLQALPDLFRRFNEAALLKGMIRL